MKVIKPLHVYITLLDPFCEQFSASIDAKAAETFVKEKCATEFATDESKEVTCFLKEIDRGGLLEPHEHTYQVLHLTSEIFF